MRGEEEPERRVPLFLPKKIPFLSFFCLLYRGKMI